MRFESLPLELISSDIIDMPSQKISSNPGLDFILTSFTSFAEKNILGINPNLEVRETTFKSPVSTNFAKNDTGVFRHYVSGGKPVIVLPQRGSGYNSAQLISCYLASRGFDAYELVTPFRASRLPEGITSMSQLPIKFKDLQTAFIQAITEVRGLARLIDKDKIGICGISLGAIYASIAYGVEERLASACLLLGGGNLPEMVEKSEDGFARALRKKLSPDEIKRLSDLDPCSYTDASKSNEMLMINATLDKDVPEKYGAVLRNAWGNPEQMQIRATHIGILKSAHKILPKMAEHYKRTL